MAVGDGANDLAMLGEAGPLVSPSMPKASGRRQPRTPKSTTRTFSALLYVQGYREEEIVWD